MATKGLLESKNSVLQNIGISALRGAAINLGVQAVGRNLRKDNLFSTLAVGAVAGIAEKGDYQKSLSQYDFEHSIIRAVKPY